MTNETTASQPKSIGDDAQFLDWLKAWSHEYENRLRDSDVDDITKQVAAYIDSRAPAAKAFATIQAAPDDMPSTIEDARKLIQYLRIEIDSKVMELYDIKKKLAATIQEPVIVAEPVREALEAARYALKHASSLYSCGFNVRHAQSSMNGTDDTGVSASEYEAAAEDIRTAVSKARDLVRTALAAPMVADPAGVVVDAKFWPQGPTQIACSSCGLTAGESRVLDALKRGEMAATIKAVASEAMPATQEPKYGIRCNRLFNRASGEFIPADEPVFIFRARDFHAADAIGWYAGGVTNFEHYRAVSDRVMQFRAFADKFPSRMKEPDTANFAAPLADKTGGGE